LTKLSTTSQHGDDPWTQRRAQVSFSQEVQQVFKAGRKMEEPAEDGCVEMWCLEVTLCEATYKKTNKDKIIQTESDYISGQWGPG